MSEQNLSKDQIVEQLLSIRELVVKGFNDRFKAVTALTLIDSLINSFSNEPLELEDYDLILYLKKKETEQIRKAIEKGELQDARILVKYAHYVSKKDFPELVETDDRNKRLKMKRELLGEIEELQRNPQDFKMDKVELTANDPILKIVKKYLI